MKPIYPALTLAAILVSFSAMPAMAADSVLQDNSVSSKFSADNAAHVDTSQIKPDHPKAGIGDGMMAVGHKHKSSALKTAPIVPAPQPGPPPPSKDIVGKHDDGDK
jgi:hypothetical protein